MERVLLIGQMSYGLLISGYSVGAMDAPGIANSAAWVTSETEHRAPGTAAAAVPARSNRDHAKEKSGDQHCSDERKGSNGIHKVLRELASCRCAIYAGRKTCVFPQGREIFQLKDWGRYLDIGVRFFAGTLQPMSTIVIYEADDLMRGLLREWLTGAGYCVSAVSPCGPRPEGEADLVIVNIEMPKHAGSSVADKIRAAHPGKPIIAISAQFRADLSTAGTIAQTLGVAQVIAKPLTRSALLAAVSAIIHPATEQVRDECPTTPT